MEKLCVEVCGINGAFYEAQVKTITDKSLEIVYENNPQLEFTVLCDCVRELPPPNAYCRKVVGAEVEVYSSTSDVEPFGWWLAHIKGVVGEWFLVEYEDGVQEFVLAEAIRSCNRNRCGSIETLVRSYQLEQEKASRQVTRQSHTVEDQGFTEESWEKEVGQPDFHLTVLPPPPKVKKPRRQKRKKAFVQYTMDDEYDDEEVRTTPQGNRLYRLYGSEWVAM